jgi:hypothetical protein
MRRSFTKTDSRSTFVSKITWQWSCIGLVVGVALFMIGGHSVAIVPITAVGAAFAGYLWSTIMWHSVGKYYGPTNIGDTADGFSTSLNSRPPMTIVVSGRDLFAVIDSAVTVFVREAFRRHLTPALILVFPVLVLALTWFFLERVAVGVVVTAAMLILLAFLAISVWMMAPKLVAKRAGHELSVEDSIELQLLDGWVWSRLPATGPNGSLGSIPCAAKWMRELDTYILIGLSPISFVVIPKRGLTAEILERLRGNLGKPGNQGPSVEWLN